MAKQQGALSSQLVTSWAFSLFLGLLMLSRKDILSSILIISSMVIWLFFFSVICAYCKLSLIVWNMSLFISNIRNDIFIFMILKVLYRVCVMDGVFNDISSVIILTFLVKYINL